MPNIGPMELIIVLVIALLILGPKRLPAAGRSLGRGILEFKAGLTGSDATDEEALTRRQPLAPPKVDESPGTPTDPSRTAGPVAS